jgi:hypothetical protein
LKTVELYPSLSCVERNTTLSGAFKSGYGQLFIPAWKFVHKFLLLELRATQFDECKCEVLEYEAGQNRAYMGNFFPPVPLYVFTHN